MRYPVNPIALGMLILFTVVLAATLLTVVLMEG